MASALVTSEAAIICNTLRYESVLLGLPIQTASSANFTCKLSLSAGEYTATVLTPISLQVRIIRNAISPRLAINIFLNIEYSGLKYYLLIGYTIHHYSTLPKVNSGRPGTMVDHIPPGWHLLPVLLLSYPSPR